MAHCSLPQKMVLFTVTTVRNQIQQSAWKQNGDRNVWMQDGHSKGANQLLQNKEKSHFYPSTRSPAFVSWALNSPVLWNMEYHYHVHSSPTLGPNLSQINPPPHPTYIKSILPSHPCLGLPSCLSPFCEKHFALIPFLLHATLVLWTSSPSTWSIIFDEEYEHGLKSHFWHQLWRVWVPIEGVWIGNWMYWPLTDRNSSNYGATATSHTLQFTAACNKSSQSAVSSSVIPTETAHIDWTAVL
jgi:hypothetical protein